MIELDTDNVYSIEQADEIIEQAVKEGTVQSPQKIKYYKMICKEEKFRYCEGHSEWFTALHGEEKREEGVRGDPNEMRWNQ